MKTASNGHKDTIYVKCQVVRGSNKIDLRILDTNEKLKKLIGKKCSGKSFLDVFTSVDEEDFLSVYQKLLVDGEEASLRKPLILNNYKYNCDLVYIQEDMLLVVLKSILEEDLLTLNLQHMITVTEEFLEYHEKDLDYKKIIDVFVELSGSKYAVFNLFSEDHQSFTTVAFSGSSKVSEKAAQILGFKIIGKTWPSDPEYVHKIKGKNVTEFTSLREIVGHSLPKVSVDMISNLFKIETTYVFTISRDNQLLGEFTIFMEKQKVLKNRQMAEIFVNQVGLLLIRHKTEQELARDRILIDTMVKSMHDIVVIINNESMITFMNNILENLVEETSVSLIGESIYKGLKYFKINEEMELYKDLQYVLDSDEIVNIDGNVMKVTYKHKKMFIEYSITPLTDNDESRIGYLIIVRDKTKKQLEHDHIEYLSHHDQLTTLYNRRFFQDALERCNKSENLPVSIIMGDVNGLKLINDSFGHAVGDQLLVSAGQILKKHAKEEDIVARIGGDEFVIIACHTPENEAMDMVNRIKEEAESRIIKGTPLSISLGFSTMKTKGKTLSHVLSEAEEYMYKHKLFESSSVHSKTLDLVINSLFEKNKREMLHSQRVSRLCKKIAKDMGFDGEILERIGVAGYLHDIGKIGIPDEILNKPDRLNAEEFNNIKRHSEIGYRMLSSVNKFSDISQYVLEHHEQCDGKGYPKGLFSHEIHPISKIICVADAFEAMIHERSYGKALTIDQALKELKKLSGTHFDENIVNIVVDIYEKEKSMQYQNLQKSE